MLAGNIYMRATMETIYIPHPGDCSKYFEVVDGVLIQHECPAGLLFCPELNACHWEDENLCTYQCSGGEIYLSKCWHEIDYTSNNQTLVRQCHPKTLDYVIYKCNTPVWGKGGIHSFLCAE